MGIISILNISTMHILTICGFSKTEYPETYKFDLKSVLTRPTCTILALTTFLSSTFARIISV